MPHPAPDPGSAPPSGMTDGCDSRDRSSGMTKQPPSRFHPPMTAPIRAPRLPDLGLDRELSARAGGYTCIAGLDEVGRGPLAGPVVSAAVVLDLERVPQGLADSKALTAARREALFAEILATSHVGIASVSHQEIDTINIRQASLLAMCRALAALPCTPDHGLRRRQRSAAPSLRDEAVIKGDSTHRLDRGGLHRRQGGARPHDGAARSELIPPMVLPAMRATARRRISR